MSFDSKPLLEQLMDSRNDADIMAAARELAPRPDLAAQAGRLLVDLLNTGAAQRAAASAFILSEWAGAALATTPNLIASLRRQTAHHNVTVRHWCVTALMRLGPRASAAIPELEKSLRDPDDGIRAMSAHALREMGTMAAAATPALIENVYDINEEVRQGAISALLRVDPHGKRAVPAIARGLTSSSSRTRQASLDALARMRTTAQPAAPAVYACVHDSNARVRRQAVAALRCLLPAERPLLHALGVAMHDQDDEVRVEAVQGLLAFANAPLEAAPLLIAALRDASQHVRFHAIDILERLAPDLGPLTAAASIAIGNCLRDESALVQTRAVKASGRMAEWTHAADTRLINALFESDGNIRLAATLALGKLHGDAVTVDALRFRLADERSDVRVAACRALADLGERASSLLPTLIHALGDSDTEVQLAALSTLESLGPLAQDALDAVQSKRTDSNPDIREAAVRAHARMECPPEAV